MMIMKRMTVTNDVEMDGDGERRTSDWADQDDADERGTCKNSALYCHLISRPDGLKEYNPLAPLVLCRASYGKQWELLEAVSIRLHKPVLCPM